MDAQRRRELTPMKAVAREAPPVGDHWVYELKWDGMRIIAFLDADGVRLQSSNGNNATDSFPELDALSELLEGFDSLVLDGEVVAMGDDGIPSFVRLQQRMHVRDRRDSLERAKDVPISYAIFDILAVNGNETLRLPFRDRRALLEQIVEAGSHWLLTEIYFGDPLELLDSVVARGLEGLVAKQLTSPYVEGKRSPTWVKVKPRLRQEFIVGGWTGGKDGNAGSLGSLLVGVMEEGALVHCGSVGSGLTDELRRSWRERLGEQSRPDQPLLNEVRSSSGRDLFWAEPTEVIEVAFHEWGTDGHLRHPVYLGHRSDKSPDEVVRESTRSR